VRSSKQELIDTREANPIWRHLRNYASGGLISALIGLITFPLLTRNLSVEDYGLVGLILATLTLFMAIGKFGIQHSIHRFYAEVINNNHTDSETGFYSTSLILGISLALATALCCVVVGYFFAPQFSQAPQLSFYFLVGGCYVFLNMINSNLSNVLSAELKSRPVMLSTITRRSIYLALLLMFLLTDMLSVASVVFAFALAELGGLVYLLTQYLPGKRHIPSRFDSELTQNLLKYGVSLMILETMGLLMRTSDRFIIQAHLGESALGQYAASYNFTGYLEVIILAAMINAVKPMYLNLWESKGRDATCRFLSQGLYFYLMIGIPFCVVFSLTASSIIKLLTGDEYGEGTVIVPWVTAAMLVEGAILFLSAGIHIVKATHRFVVWGLLAVAINIALNSLFVPMFGIVGASVVTFITYCIYCFGLAYSAFKILSFRIQLFHPVIMLLAGCGVWFVLNKINTDSHVYNFVVQGGLSTIILISFALTIDRQLRTAALKQYAKLGKHGYQA